MILANVCRFGIDNKETHLISDEHGGLDSYKLLCNVLLWIISNENEKIILLTTKSKF